VTGFGRLWAARSAAARGVAPNFAGLAKPKFMALVPECAAILGMVGLIWAGIWTTLAEQRSTLEAAAARDTGNLARAFEENTDRIIAGGDQTLLALRAAYAREGAGFDLRAWARRENSPDRLTAQMAVIDRDGMSVASTASTQRVSVADREHFVVHRDSQEDVLYVSKPVLGRSSQRWTIQLTRKILDADGSFGGVVVLSVDCYDLSRFYETLDLQAGSISLVGTDGILRAQGPVAADAIGKPVPESLLQAGVMRERQGTLHATIDADGSPSTISFRRLRNYKLIVMVAFQDEQVFAQYDAISTRLLAGGAGATVVILFLGAAWIEQRRRSLRSKRALSLTLENMSQGIVMIDERGRVPVANRRAMELLGLPSSSVGGADPGLASHLRSIGAAGEAVDGTATLRRGGRLIEAHSHLTPFGGAVLTYTDVTDRKRDEARILHLAQHDGLTGLANRMLLNERIAEAARDARTHGSRFAVLTLDLDGFKAVNDGLGHEGGDLLLVSVAERLQGAVRAHDTVARVGGDEFTIVLRDIAQPRIAERIAQALVDTLAQPVSIRDGLWVVGASIGVAMFPEDGSDAGTLLKNADIALYRAKEGGRNQFCRYDQRMSEMLEERRWLDRALRLGLERNEFEVYFQPQFGCDTLAVAGFEALVRWRHPERGMISPAVFIPAAEECGLIVPIGRMVLEQACAFAATWRPRCRVAVNLSPVQFRDTGLPELLRRILRRTGLPPEMLELEVTEGVLIRDEAQALETLQALRAIGVCIALDDFGTGYSSLSYLHRFSFDKVKIDKSFVQAQQHDTRARAVLDAVFAMSSSLGLSVTAEGVETEDQLRSLRAQGCTEVQGFLLGRPMPASEVAGFTERAAGRARQDDVVPAGPMASAELGHVALGA
jgi:diguanylate cyclase (GGDEF)-like protein